MLQLLNEWPSKTHRGLSSTSINALKRLTRHIHFPPLSLLHPAETLFVVLKLFHQGSNKIQSLFFRPQLMKKKKKNLLLLLPCRDPAEIGL